MYSINCRRLNIIVQTNDRLRCGSTNEDEIYVFPATHYSAGPERMERAITGIEAELAIRLQDLEAQNKLLEAQRLRMRSEFSGSPSARTPVAYSPARATQQQRLTLQESRDAWQTYAELYKHSGSEDPELAALEQSRFASSAEAARPH